jgi:hypothetical protein
MSNPHFTHLLLHQTRVAENSLRGIAGLIGRQAGIPPLLGLQFQMGKKPALQISLPLFPPPPPHLNFPSRAT